MKQVLNYYWNKKTRVKIAKWETKKQYENHSFKFMQEYTQYEGDLKE